MDVAEPSPKFHRYVGVGKPVDELVMATGNGAAPDVADIVNAAVGTVVTTIVLVAWLDPVALVAVRVAM